MRLALSLIVLAGLNSTIGNLFLKQSRLVAAPDASWYANFISPYFVGAVFFYMVSLVFFARALDAIPVSIGYPILSGCGFVTLMVASSIVFKEQLVASQILGVALILGGIALAASRL